MLEVKEDEKALTGSGGRGGCGDRLCPPLWRGGCGSQLHHALQRRQNRRLGCLHIYRFLHPSTQLYTTPPPPLLRHKLTPPSPCGLAFGPRKRAAFGSSESAPPAFCIAPDIRPCYCFRIWVLLDFVAVFRSAVKWRLPVLLLVGRIKGRGTSESFNGFCWTIVLVSRQLSFEVRSRRQYPRAVTATC
jgi:hypothetical protein